MKFIGDQSQLVSSFSKVELGGLFPWVTSHNGCAVFEQGTHEYVEYFIPDLFRNSKDQTDRLILGSYVLQK